MNQLSDQRITIKQKDCLKKLQELGLNKLEDLHRKSLVILLLEESYPDRPQECTLQVESTFGDTGGCAVRVEQILRPYNLTQRSSTSCFEQPHSENSIIGYLDQDQVNLIQKNDSKISGSEEEHYMLIMKGAN